MRSYNYKKWFSNFVSLGNALLKIGAVGEVSLTVKPRMPREEAQQLLLSITPIAGPALPFLLDLYSLIGAGMSMTAAMHLPQDWEATYGEQFYANFDLCGPQDLLDTWEINKGRAEGIENWPAFPVFPERDQAEWDPSQHALEQFVTNASKDHETLSAILRNCLMFCRDDTGGGAAYYNGEERPKGVYSMTMDGAELIAPSMEHFFDMVEEHAFEAPVSDIDWNASAAKVLRDRLRLESADLSAY